MQIGVKSFTRGAGVTREAWITMARDTERLGFAFIAAPDHIIVPKTVASRYPYSETGAWAATATGECLDQITTLSVVAGATERIRLLTSVLVVPQRPAVLTAKMLATLDVLSGGRLIVGCGAGWLEEEFAAVDAPPFAERGRVTDEWITVFKKLWTNEVAAFAGGHVSFDEVVFAPRPVQKPHPPIWIGGEGAAAMRRVVRLGDGWYPASNNPQHRLDTPARLSAAVKDLHRHAAEAGRDAATIDLAHVVLWPISWTAEMLADGSGRRPLTGSAADMAADVAAYRAAGVRHLALVFQTATLAETRERMQRFAEQVMPLVEA